MNFKIFIVEDDPWYAQILKHHLSLNPDYEIELYDSAANCLAQLHTQPDVICIDYGLPDMDGEQLLAKIHSLNNTIPVIVISAQEKIAVAVDLLKAGARDYIIKNDHTKELLWRSLINIRENAHLRKEVAVFIPIFRRFDLRLLITTAFLKFYAENKSYIHFHHIASGNNQLWTEICFRNP